jgi:hypothetical protein
MTYGSSSPCRRRDERTPSDPGSTAADGTGPLARPRVQIPLQIVAPIIDVKKLRSRSVAGSTLKGCPTTWSTAKRTRTRHDIRPGCAMSPPRSRL